MIYHNLGKYRVANKSHKILWLDLHRVANGEQGHAPLSVSNHHREYFETVKLFQKVLLDMSVIITYQF